MITETLDTTDLHRQAVYLLVQSKMADRAGANPAECPVHRKAQDAVETAVAAGASHTDIHREAGIREAIHVLSCQLPGYEPAIDYDGARYGVAA